MHECSRALESSPLTAQLGSGNGLSGQGGMLQHAPQPAGVAGEGSADARHGNRFLRQRRAVSFRQCKGNKAVLSLRHVGFVQRMRSRSGPGSRSGNDVKWGPTDRPRGVGGGAGPRSVGVWLPGCPCSGRNSHDRCAYTFIELPDVAGHASGLRIGDSMAAPATPPQDDLPAILVTDLDYRAGFFGPLILHDIDLNLPQGARCLLCGANGSGTAGAWGCAGRACPAPLPAGGAGSQF